jgi:signal transduction histidine kinase
MFSKKGKSRFNQISSRLALTYLCFFIPCYLITFGIFYVWTSDFLKTRDHDLIDARISQYQEIIEKEGFAGIERIYTDKQLHIGASKYLMELRDNNGKVLFFHMSEELFHQRFNDVEKQMDASSSLASGTWFFLVSADHDYDAFEVRTVVLNNNLRLNIGASTDARDLLLEKFQVMFLTIFIPLLISSILLSVFIAKTLLRPIKNLSRLINEIKGGNLSPRAKLPGYKDELYDLTFTFNSMLDQVENLIDTMKDTLDNVAHDLRTPLARARLASELALKSDSPEKLKLAAEEGIENLDIILKMIQTIMTMSELNSKTFILNKVNFLAHDIIDEIIDLYLFVAEDKRITISSQCDEGATVFADRLMVRQALANLIDNAIKYSPPDTEVSIRCYPENGQIHFIVQDQGAGIPKEDISRIWERLYRGDKSRTEKGFGLGLSLVKIFIESNKGVVSVESEVGKGSTFKCSLPLA